ncbi:MAG: DUF1015 domain-containing protein [Oligoflexia bacterium]|nr:DUF1015 domain-containing protein [Oligoflexia bacterium]
MAVVKPFQAWRYDTQKVGSLAKVVVPPYDVISPVELKNMKQMSSWNFSHVILAEGENKHQKASENVKQWMEQGALIQDQKPSLYFYKQEFKLDRYELFCQDIPPASMKNGTLSRTGIFCRVGLEDYENKVILPHEKTFAGPKADRYQLMESAQGNMEPVFLGYDSPRFSGDEFEKIVAGKEPLYSFTDNMGVEHKLWNITDVEIIKDVEKTLGNQKFYILDGHHRYETALKFFKDHQGEKESQKYVLANICSFKQPGTVILPTHRLVKGLKNFSKDSFLSTFEQDFEITPVATLGDIETQLKLSPTTAFGVMLSDGGYHLMRLKRTSDLLKSGKLDLELLHENILELMGSPKEEDIAYVKSISEFEDRLKKSEFQVGFLVRPTTCDDVMAVAHKFGKMPHKSTFFYPKIPSGLIINKF